MFKISIPTPCHEDWNKMSPGETGRHCSSCARSVVDFTGMNDDEVKYFFLNKKEEKVCGRFKQTQLQQIVIDLPQNIFSIEMPLWKKFLVACLLVFSTTLFSCETKVNGKLVNKEKGSQLTKKQEKEQINLSHMILGTTFPWDSIPALIETSFTTVGITEPKFIIDTTVKEVTGDLEIIPEDSINPKKCESLSTRKPSSEIIFTGDIILIDTLSKKLQVDIRIKPPKTKNPPKADSPNCNTMKYY